MLLSGNKRDRIETLTQCAECLQFVIDNFLGINNNSDSSA